MSEEYQDRANALLKGLKSNPKDEPNFGGSGSSSVPGQPGGAPIKKKKKKLWLILIPLVLLLGVGAFVGLVFAGLVRNPQLEAILKIKRKGAVEKPTAEVAKVDPAASTDSAPPADPPKPHVGRPRPPTVDPQKGAQKLAAVWSEMDPDKVSKLAVGFKDEEFAQVLAEMDPDKAAAILTALDPKRSSKISKVIQANASVIKPEE
jgi:hypothetical protein